MRPVWSESSLFAWRKLVPLATHWAHSESYWVFARRTYHFVGFCHEAAHLHYVDLLPHFFMNVLKELKSVILLASSGSKFQSFAASNLNYYYQTLLWVLGSSSRFVYMKTWRKNWLAYLTDATMSTKRWNLLQTKNWAASWQNNKVSVRPAKTQITLGIRPVCLESSLCAQWVAKDPSCLHADSEDTDQTGWMPRLIWVFAGRTATLLVLSRVGSNARAFVLVYIKWIRINYYLSEILTRGGAILRITSGQL